MRRTLRHRLLPLLLLAGCDPIWSVSGRAYRCDDRRLLEGVGVTHEYRKVPPQGESLSLCLTPMTPLPPME